MNLFSLTRLNSVDRSFYVSMYKRREAVNSYYIDNSKLFCIVAKAKPWDVLESKASQRDLAWKKVAFAHLSLAASPLLVPQHMTAWSKAILFLNHVLAMIHCTLLNHQQEKIECSFLLRLKRLHVELVSWVPAWIK